MTTICGCCGRAFSPERSHEKLTGKSMKVMDRCLRCSMIRCRRTREGTLVPSKECLRSRPQ